MSNKLLKVLIFLIRLCHVVGWDFNEIDTLLNEIKAIQTYLTRII